MADKGSFQPETPLDDLIARLEAASGPDRQADRQIAKAIDPTTWRRATNWAAMPCGAPADTVERDALRWVPDYTTSLDAALALAERVLPGHGPIDMTVMGSAKVTIWSNEPCGRDLSDAFGHTPALALCIAVLKAHAVGTERSVVSPNPAGGK